MTPSVTSVTPMPSETVLRFILSPVGTVSIFGFKTPIPYPFGAERTGYLVTDLDSAVRAAEADGAEVYDATVIRDAQDRPGKPGLPLDRQGAVR
jgi:hypothetical protein